eukprot:4679366-Prymnesium_polylepis.1
MTVDTSTTRPAQPTDHSSLSARQWVCQWQCAMGRRAAGQGGWDLRKSVVLALKCACAPSQRSVCV